MEETANIIIMVYLSVINEYKVTIIIIKNKCLNIFQYT